MKPIRRAPTSRNKIAPRPSRSKSSKGEAPGPDERRPEVKADEIYGDTKIPERSRKK